MGYAVRRLKGETLGAAAIAIGIGGIYGSYAAGFFNIPSAACWIVGLIALLRARELSEAGLWTGHAGLVLAHGVGAMCALYAFAGIFLAPMALFEVAVYAADDPALLTQGAAMFVFGYVLPAVIWLKIFLELD